jgi:hypothetical protein
MDRLQPALLLVCLVSTVGLAVSESGTAHTLTGLAASCFLAVLVGSGAGLVLIRRRLVDPGSGLSPADVERLRARWLGDDLFGLPSRSSPSFCSSSLRSRDVETCHPVANEAVADRPAGVPEVVRRQLDEADEVRVVAPALTGRLQSWVSDIDGAALEADERMRTIVGDIPSSGKDVRGQVGDEDPLQAVADTLALFPADALILGVHPPDVVNWRERRFSEKVRERFDLPVTEMVLDREGRVISVTSD